MINTPTAITLSRILLVPVFIITAVKDSFIGAIVFSIASATDFLDGYIARRSKQITKIGVLLDPIADKLLVIAALIILVDLQSIQSWIAIVIIIREFFVTGLRVVAISKDIIIPAETGGKIKMVMQIAAIFLLLIHHSHVLAPIISPIGLNLHLVGVVCLWASMIIGVLSAMQYVVSFCERV